MFLLRASLSETSGNSDYKLVLFYVYRVVFWATRIKDVSNRKHRVRLVDPLRPSLTLWSYITRICRFSWQEGAYFQV